MTLLEIGCETGNLLALLMPRHGVGIDFSSNVIEIAKSNHPDLESFIQDAEKLGINETFDFIHLRNNSIFHRSLYN